MDPNVNRGESQECLEARGKPLPAHHQTTILLLEPSKGALGLESRHHLLYRSALGFLRLPDALGALGPDTTLRSFSRNAFASYPFSVAMTRSRLRGRPRLPVRILTASSNGRTCARSSPLAGVVRLARGMPPPSVRLWMSIPLPFPPRATPSPPPLPGGKSAIDGAILPMNHPPFLGHPQTPGLHRGERA